MSIRPYESSTIVHNPFPKIYLSKFFFQFTCHTYYLPSTILKESRSIEMDKQSAGRDQSAALNGRADQSGASEGSGPVYERAGL